MNYELVKSYDKHLVKLFCKNSITWSGRVLKVDTDCLLLRDKFGREVLVSFDTIENLQDLGLGGF